MITGTISASDYLDAQRLHGERVRRWYFYICAAVITAGIAFTAFGLRRPGVTLVFVAIIGLVVEYLIWTFYLPRKIRHLHRQQKDFALPFTYWWDAEFIESKSDNGQSKRRWRNYAKFKENETMFLLYHADNMFEALPKNWFRDQAQIDEFRRFAKPDTIQS
jgi:YcxB-like protein